MAFEDFNIEHGKFRLGIHTIKYHLDGDFFQLFENSSLNEGSIEVEIEFEKKPNSLIFNISLNGSVGLNCDRCLNDLAYNISEERSLFVKFSEFVKESEDDDLIYINPSESNFNVSSYLYEIISLALPMRVICEDVGNECNPEVISKLNKISIENENEKNMNDNPEWDKLKNIIDKLK